MGNNVLSQVKFLWQHPLLSMLVLRVFHWFEWNHFLSVKSWGIQNGYGSLTLELWHSKNPFWGLYIFYTRSQGVAALVSASAAETRTLSRPAGLWTPPIPRHTTTLSTPHIHQLQQNPTRNGSPLKKEATLQGRLRESAHSVGLQTSPLLLLGMMIPLSRSLTGLFPMVPRQKWPNYQALVIMTCRFSSEPKNTRIVFY